jgi:hypothetical protein
VKTKVGNIILKRNSKNMDKLNARFITIAVELKAQTKMTEYVGSLLDEAKENRIEHERLQEEINLLCQLEAYTKYR